MNWLEFLELTSILVKQLQVSQSQFQLSEPNLKRRSQSPNPSAIEKRRSVLSPLRLRTSISNWIAQLLRMFKSGSCLVQPHFRLHSQMCYRLHNLGNTGQVVSFWGSHVNQLLQLARMGQLLQRRLAITARTWVMMLTIVCVCKDERLSCHVKINLGVG